MKRILCAVLAMAMLLGATTIASFASADSILYGDANGDSSINNLDVALLQQQINGWEVTLDAVAADANGDGSVNNLDVALLQKYINGWDVQLGPDLPEVPPAELPAAGYDLDGAGRIVVESISQSGYEVTVTLANICTDWITEEVSYVQYTCTDADGNVLTLEDKYYGTLYFGQLEVGDRFTTTLTLPEGTTKLEFGKTLIRYWTPWH